MTKQTLFHVCKKPINPKALSKHKWELIEEGMILLSQKDIEGYWNEYSHPRYSNLYCRLLGRRQCKPIVHLFLRCPMFARYKRSRKLYRFRLYFRGVIRRQVWMIRRCCNRRKWGWLQPRTWFHRCWIQSIRIWMYYWEDFHWYLLYWCNRWWKN